MGKNTEILVSNTLKELGISANRCGYGYIKEAIRFCLNPRNAGYNMTMLYAHIADMYSAKWTNVERGIRSSIETGLGRGNPDMWARIFISSYSSYKGKPTNSEFIATLVEYIQLYEED